MSFSMACRLGACMLLLVGVQGMTVASQGHPETTSAEVSASGDLKKVESLDAKHQPVLVRKEPHSDSEAPKPNGKEVGKEVGKEAGKKAGKEAGKELGKKAGKEAGKEAGKKPGKEAGKDLAQVPDHGKEETGKEADKHADKEAGKEAGKNSDKEAGKDADKDTDKDADKETAAVAYTGKPVSIEVYYETRCPGCVMFINQTLEPLWRHTGLTGVLNISMYTYGNGMTVPVANISDGYRFWHEDTTGKAWKDVQICQHGSDECLGNLVQVCTKDVASNAKYMELIFCMAATTIQGYSTEKSTFDCMVKAGVDTKKVKTCVRSPRGNQLMTDVGKLTNAVQGRLGTPWVMIQGQHAADNLLQNSTLLLQSICTHANNVPGPCSAFKAVAPPTAPSPTPSDGGGGDDFQVFNSIQDKTLLKVSPKHV